MSEIYQIYEIEQYDSPNDKGELTHYLGTWEKIGNQIREVICDLHSYEIEDGDDICKTIEKSGEYSDVFEDLDEYIQKLA